MLGENLVVSFREAFSSPSIHSLELTIKRTANSRYETVNEALLVNNDHCRDEKETIS